VVAVSGSYETAITSRNGMKGDPGDPGPAGAGVPDPATGTPGTVLTLTSSGPAWQSQAAGITGAPSVWPSAFPALAHTHVVSQLTDASTVGRAVMSAADAQAARAAIGAGTGNGTSNLTLGATSTTAMPGDRSFNATELVFTPTSGSPVTATTVKAAIEQAAATGGSGTSSNVLVWRYASGAYPTLPTSKPTGIEVVQAYGPVQPTSIPSWVGSSTGQALGRYEYAALT
jgi:hypothetical protein